jgi:hypothetical protein
LYAVYARGGAKAKAMERKKCWKGKEDANQRLRKRIDTKGILLWVGV